MALPEAGTSVNSSGRSTQALVCWGRTTTAVEILLKPASAALEVLGSTIPYHPSSSQELVKAMLVEDIMHLPVHVTVYSQLLHAYS
jgi:hypothetical protein